MIKWPCHIKPGTVVSDMFASYDWFPTLVAAAGDSNIKQEMLKGYKTPSITYKVHLDGYNQLDFLQGKGKDQRNEFFYWSDDGDLLAMRQGRWKIHFMIREHTGLDLWRYPFTKLRAPMIFDLAVDPLEKGDRGMGYQSPVLRSHVPDGRRAEVGKKKCWRRLKNSHRVRNRAPSPSPMSARCLTRARANNPVTNFRGGPPPCFLLALPST